MSVEGRGSNKGRRLGDLEMPAMKGSVCVRFLLQKVMGFWFVLFLVVWCDGR